MSRGSRNADGTVSKPVGSGRPMGGGHPQGLAPLRSSVGQPGPRVIKRSQTVIDKKQSDKA